MEKKRVSLLELFNVDPDKYSDLNKLYVVKVDVYKPKPSINIVIEGVESLDKKNSLVSLVHELENDFGTKVSFTFSGFDEINFSTYYDHVCDLIKYYVSRDSGSGVNDVTDYLSIRVENDYESSSGLQP